MLKTTNELIEHLKLDKQLRDYRVVESLVYAVLKCGDKSDADVLLLHYLQDPFEYSQLVPVVKKFGDYQYAEQIYDVCIQKNILNEKTNPDLEILEDYNFPKILEVLAYLKFKPIKQLLANLAFVSGSGLESLGVYPFEVTSTAALGLLNFDCEEFQDSIETEIEKCYGQNLFLEFVPALVCKLKNKSQVLEKLYDLGKNYASSDCNAGIILGFSLCGEEGRKYFKEVLFDNSWEAYSGSTGTLSCTYQGMKNLDITFKELYSEIKQLSDKVQLNDSLYGLFSLLECKVQDYESNDKESFTDIYTQLYSWETMTTSNTIVDLARKVDLESEAYRIEQLIEMKMNEEILLKNFGR